MGALRCAHTFLNSIGGIEVEIRVYKGELEEGKCFALGFGGESSRHPHIQHTRIAFPSHFCHATIMDGFVETPAEGGFTVENTKTYEPVSAIEIAEALLSANNTVRGRKLFNGYGEKARWFFDYTPDLKEFFEKHRIPIPEDGRSKFERVQESALKSLEERGLIKRGIGGADADGVGAIEAAKLKKQQEELEATKAEIEKLKAELAANKAETKVAKENLAAVSEEVLEKPKKALKKKKEEVKE